MDRRTKSMILLALVLIVAGWYLSSQWDNLSALIKLRPGYLFPLLLAVFSQMSVNGLITKVCVSCFQIDLEFKEWLGLAVITTMGNYLAPFRGGMAGKAVYLKKKHHLHYSEFLATVAASMLIIMLEGSIGGILAVIIIYLSSGGFHYYLGLLLTLAALAILLVLTNRKISERLSHISSENKWAAGLRNGMSGWKLLKSDHEIIMKIAVLGLVNYFLITLQLFFSAKALSIELSLLSAWFISIFSGFALLLSITPANLGVNETVIGGISQLSGPGFHPGILLASLIRIVNILIVFALGPLFSYWLLRNITD